MFENTDLQRFQGHVRNAKQYLSSKNQDQALGACVAALEDASKVLQKLHDRVRRPSFEVGQIVKKYGDGCFDVLVRPGAPWGHIPAMHHLCNQLSVGQLVVVRFFRDDWKSPYIEKAYDLPFAVEIVPEVESVSAPAGE